jgi:hypothetical protein
LRVQWRENKWLYETDGNRRAKKITPTASRKFFASSNTAAELLNQLRGDGIDINMHDEVNIKRNCKVSFKNIKER